MAKKPVNEELRKVWEETIRAAVHPHDMKDIDWNAVIPMSDEEAQASASEEDKVAAKDEANIKATDKFVMTDRKL